MIKALALSSLLVSGLCLGSSDDKRNGSGPNCQPNSWQSVTTQYVELMNEYKDVQNDNSLTHEEKVEKLIEISEEMRQVDPEGCYLNQDYNDCMRESNAQQRSDYDRCERNGNNDSCYDRADRNNDNRRGACERVGHSDNIKDGVESISNGDHGGGSSNSRGGSRGKKSGGHINAADRRR